METLVKKPLWLRLCYSHHPMEEFMTVHLPCLVFFLWVGWEHAQTPFIVTGLFLAGLAFWTIIEYFMHRFAFHWSPKNLWLREKVDLIHKHHHDRPEDFTILIAGPLFAVPQILFSWLILGVIMAFHFEIAALVMMGAVVGHFLYEIVHYSVHAIKPTKGIFGFYTRYHLYHHHRNSKQCFGVTTAFWDKVFGTYWDK